MAKQSRTIGKFLVKVFHIFVVIGLLLSFTILVINVHMKRYVKDNIKNIDDVAGFKADCILVLGAGLWDEDTPSALLADRITRGVQLYQKEAGKKLLMSGDHGQRNHDEVGVMRAWAIKVGVPSSDIFLDHAGFSTYESIYRAKYIFDVKTIVIVTQAFHLERAVYIAEKLGLKAYGVSSDLRNYRGIIYNEARDILARVKDFFMVIFKPKPTYLGEKISLLGNGEVTLG